MNRCALLVVMVALMAFSGCTKTRQTTEIKNDNTGTVSLNVSVKSSVLAQIKQDVESGAMPPEALDHLEDQIDEKKIVQRYKELGLEVVTSKVSESEGWRSTEIVAKVPDVNAWVAKVSKMAAEKADEFESQGVNMPTIPTGGVQFYKTDSPKVGQIVLLAPPDDRFSDMMDQLNELPEEQRPIIEARLEMQKQKFALDEMVNELTIKLPGKILTTTGCKKIDDHSVVFSMKGSEVTLDGMKTTFGMKDGVSATFEVPENCKIQFADAPGKGKQVAPTPIEEAGKSEEKKGGLKIGEEDGKGN